MDYPERVETEHLILRRWEPSDGPAMAAIWAQPEIWRAMHPGLPFDPSHWRGVLERRLLHWEHYGFGLWAVAERDGDGLPAGWAGAHHPTFVPELANEVEVAWTLRPGLWGRGLATEGGAAGIDAAFTYLEAERVISLILEGNKRSIAVASRLGMSHADDVIHPDLDEKLGIYALPRTAWRPSSSRGASPQSTSSR